MPGRSNNSIGAAISGAGNLISANGFASATLTGVGVAISGSGIAGNLVAGNFIGTDASGTKALGNASDGVDLVAGAAGDTVGGSTRPRAKCDFGQPGQRRSDLWGFQNVVAGNLIGADATGASVIGNSPAASFLTGFSGLRSSTRSGAFRAASATSSWAMDSARPGCRATEFCSMAARTSQNLVLGNLIGLFSNGMAAGNAGNGVQVEDSADNTIGGLNGGGNTIAFNISAGRRDHAIGGQPGEQRQRHPLELDLFEREARD